MSVFDVTEFLKLLSNLVTVYYFGQKPICLELDEQSRLIEEKNSTRIKMFGLFELFLIRYRSESLCLELIWQEVLYFYINTL